MSDPRMPDPRNNDPAYEDRPTLRPSYTDPDLDPTGDPLRLDPVLEDRPIDTRGRSGLIMAGILVALLVIAAIAFSSGTMTDPGTTAVIPEQSQQTTPDTTAAPEVTPQPTPATPPAE